MVDMKELAWQDNDGQYYQIIDLTQAKEDDLVWFENTKTLDRHCMSADLFVAKHKACGFYRKKKHA